MEFIKNGYDMYYIPTKKGDMFMLVLEETFSSGKTFKHFVACTRDTSLGIPVHKNNEKEEK